MHSLDGGNDGHFMFGRSGAIEDGYSKFTHARVIIAFGDNLKLCNSGSGEDFETDFAEMTVCCNDFAQAVFFDENCNCGVGERETMVGIFAQEIYRLRF